jgi:hypothetical protein
MKNALNTSELSNTSNCRASILSTCDQEAARKLGLTATPSIKRKSYSMSLAPEKIQTQNLKFGLLCLLRAYCFYTTIKSKSHESNHHELGGPSIIYLCDVYLRFCIYKISSVTI